jgi:deoxyribonuclease-4
MSAWLLRAILGSLYDTISSQPGCKCTQMFLGDPVTYNCQTITKEDKNRTLEYCTRTDTTFYIHCPLIANLAKPDCSRSVNVISKELDAVSGLPGACVLHIGKVGTIENVAQRINEIQGNGHLPVSHHSRVPFHLLLEIAAGQGTELGRSWEEIRHLYEALDHSRVGLCVDTQHAFASGMCSFQTHEDVVRLFDSATNIAPKGISMIHLNDSAKPFGSRVDRHASLRNGHIWSQSDEGLRSLIEISKSYGMDLVSETDDPASDSVLVDYYMNNTNKTTPKR